MLSPSQLDKVFLTRNFFFKYISIKPIVASLRLKYNHFSQRYRIPCLIHFLIFVKLDFAHLAVLCIYIEH